jgi:hypothetical protein
MRQAPGQHVASPIAWNPGPHGPWPQGLAGDHWNASDLAEIGNGSRLELHEHPISNETMDLLLGKVAFVIAIGHARLELG